MPIPLHLLELKLKEARLNYPAVERNMALRGVLLGYTLAKGRVPTPQEQDYMYRQKKTRWRCRVRVTPQGVQKRALLWWWHGPKHYHNEALDALLLRGHRLPLHFDTHFWSRWGLRSEVMGAKLTNLMSFFRQYPDLPMYQGERFYNAQPEFAAAIDQGLVLARPNGTRIISCDTFKHLAFLSTDERELWERLRRKDAGRRAA
ncbi:MAG: hypothetical protein IPH05_07700 [Flavobacteriales bacterium]|jgi:hypothetical protein|nr:hypothetical protein [Flavobacteriales bacterium]MBK6882812.1 hypothetical protein [Flavobacteriales bacterium]MBK7114154.1 hypothetical protein [Flavobacteriales bacterium]MBK7483793.1 hypothetical protein [Flavobacteriales bacterium]MBK7620057.1 hypothetical protein [Flavobacteriales bacterium]